MAISDGEIRVLLQSGPDVHTALVHDISVESRYNVVKQWQGSHSDWKTWKNGKAFSSQGKVREF